MVERRLQNLERRLFMEPGVAKEYAKVIDGHLEKGYITKLPPVEDDDTVKWYLPHFPVDKKSRSTTKVHIVFNASADIALNNVIFQGPKLLCDISWTVTEMYLRVELDPNDRLVFMERYTV